MTALIEMTQVTKTYGERKMKVVALHETNFQLNTGEFVAIVGPFWLWQDNLSNNSRTTSGSIEWKDSSKGEGNRQFDGEGENRPPF